MKHLLLGILLVSSCWASGQNKPTGMTLQQCIDIATSNNLQVQQSRLQAEADNNTARQARFNAYPNLNGNIGQGLSLGRSIDPFTNTFSTQTIGFNNFSVGSGITLFNGGVIKNTAKQTEITALASQQDVQNSRNQLILNVVLAFLQVLSSEDQKGITEKQVEVTNLQLNRTKKLVSAGALPEANLLDLEAQLANDELAVVTATNNIELAKLQLLQLMNDRSLNDISLNRMSINTPTSDYPQGVSEIYAAAEGTQPNIRAADLRIQAAAKGVEIAKGGLLPTAGFNFNLGTNYSSIAQQRVFGELVPVSTNALVNIGGQNLPVTITTQQPDVSFQKIRYFNQLNTNLNAGVNLGLRFPIFNAYQARVRIANATLNQRGQQLQAENVRLQLRQTIEQAYLNMTAAQKRLVALNKQTEALQNAFRVAEKRLEAGAINAVDYNLAKTNLDRANLNVISARYDLVLRTKVLDFYQNKPLSF